MSSITRSTFTGGFGLNAYRALAGAGRNYLSPYGAANAIQLRPLIFPSLSFPFPILSPLHGIKA
jgi:hypothetical protein